MEVSQTLANSLAALAAAHIVHSLMEPMGMRRKLKRLVAYMDGGTFKETPININSRLKGISIGYALAAILFLLAFFIVSIIDPSPSVATQFSIASMVFVELVNTVVIDRYHAEIEVVTKRFRK